LASIFGKLKQATKRKIIHSTFDLFRSILDAVEEEMTGEDEQNANNSKELLTASEIGLPPLWSNVSQTSAFQLDWIPDKTVIDNVLLRVSTKVNHGYLKVEYKLTARLLVHRNGVP